MTNDAFISYSKADKATADAICQALEAHDLKCWYAPRDIPGGVDWDASIMKALANSRVMILVWSSLSDASKQVKREVSIALDVVGIPLIPYRTEEIASQNLGYFLANIQWLDATQPPLEDNLQRLVKLVKESITQGSDSGKRQSQVSSPASSANEETGPDKRAPDEVRIKATDEALKLVKKDALGSSVKTAKGKAPEKGDRSAELLIEIEKVLDDCNDSHLYLGRAIPSAKLANALSKYPPDSSPKDVLVFFDNTVFGGGKSSLILTPEAVYWFNNISGATGRIGYVDIETVRFMASSGFFDANKILINQEEIEFYAGTSEVAAALAKVIRHLVAQRKSAS